MAGHHEGYKLDQFATPGVVVEVKFRRRNSYPSPYREGILFKDVACSVIKFFGVAEVDDIVQHYYERYVLPPPLPPHGVWVPSCQRLYPGIARPVECAWVLVVMECAKTCFFRIQLWGCHCWRHGPISGDASRRNLPPGQSATKIQTESWKKPSHRWSRPGPAHAPAAPPHSSEGLLMSQSA